MTTISTIISMKCTVKDICMLLGNIARQVNETPGHVWSDIVACSINDGQEVILGPTKMGLD